MIRGSDSHGDGVANDWDQNGTKVVAHAHTHSRTEKKRRTDNDEPTH